MKTNKFFKNLNSLGFKHIIATVIIAVMLICTVGCKNETVKPSDSSVPSVQSSSESSLDSSQNSSSDNASSESQAESASTEVTVSKEIAASGSIQEGNVRSDINELEPSVDISGNLSGYKGYADKERNALLKEILNTENTEKLYDIKGTIYYVSTKGNDNNDGLSPKKPLKTLDAVGALQLKKGDAVLFERGCIWRLLDAFSSQTGVIYGSYGEGRKPMFLGSATNFANVTWEPSKKKNVWKTNYIYFYPAGVFFEEGKESGYQKLNLRDMTKNTDYYFDEENATLYLYCDKGNPAKVWKSIEVSQSSVLINNGVNVTDTVFDNLCIRYCGNGGIGATYNNRRITVTNCEIGFTGGQWQNGSPSKGKVRYGNGIGTWCGGSGMKWNHNWIYQTFDSAVSPQGNTGILTGQYDNISICNNLFEYNNCDIESWEHNTEKPVTYSNNHYDNNIMRFTSLGWGTRIDDGGIRGIDGVHYGDFYSGQVKGITFNNNIIDCPGRGVYSLNIHGRDSYNNFTRKNNIYYFKNSLRSTNLICSSFHWTDTDGPFSYSATTKDKVIDIFSKIEPTAKVYWYN